MYACTLSTADRGGEQERRPRLSHSVSASGGLGSPALTPRHSPCPGISPAVMMVSKHVDGSLNQVQSCLIFSGTLCVCSALPVLTLVSRVFTVGGYIRRALRLL